jgi:hypothetical protein
MGRWSSDAIERQLGHEEQNAARRAYTHAAEYWSERVAMMQAWADYLGELRNTERVIPIRESVQYWLSIVAHEPQRIAYGSS